MVQPVPVGRQRLFADDYSCSGQCAWKAGERGPVAADGDGDGGARGNPHWRRDFLGQLRFDSLVSRRLVVPDTYLLDGSFFLATPPDVLRRELGRPESRQDEDGLTIPIAFRLRAPTLERTLAAFLLDEGRPQLNPFMFKVVADEAARKALALALGACTRDQLARHIHDAGQVIPGVMRLLRECAQACGVETAVGDDLAVLERGWSHWVEHERTICVEVYAPDTGQQPAAASDVEMLDAVAEGYGSSAACALEEIKARASAGLLTRSAATHVLDRHRAAAAGDAATIWQIDEIEAWYSRVRFRRLARQHGAQFVQLLDERRAVGPLQRWCESVIARRTDPPDSRIELPEEIIAGLADMDDAEWRRFVGDHLRSLDRWWREGSTDALKGAIDGLGERVASSRTTSTVFGMVIPSPLLAASFGTAASMAASDLGASGRVVAGVGSLTAAAATVVLANEGRVTARRVQHRMLDVARATTSV